MPAPADWSLGASEAPTLLEGDLPGLLRDLGPIVAKFLTPTPTH